MATITFKNGAEILSVDASKLMATSTKSLYIRTGHLSGKKFLSQKHTGNGGAGDVCQIEQNAEVNVNENLFLRIYQYALKAGAIA